jgi:uncharacterized protein YqhQ|tara:strand:+ start:367 stop:588 length:222 start_codon:yes stop_codon:yes gene_type:complete
MSKRKTQGFLIFTLAIIAFFVYAYLLMLSEWSPVVLQLSLLVLVGGILGVISWIGYVMVTTKSSGSSIIQDED